MSGDWEWIGWQLFIFIMYTKFIENNFKLQSFVYWSSIACNNNILFNLEICVTVSTCMYILIKRKKKEAACEK